MQHKARKRTQAELLALVDVLEPLSKEELEELAAHCPSVHFNRGNDLYHPKEHDGGLFLIQEGRVRVYRSSLQGDQLTLALLPSGTVLSARRLLGLHAEVMEPSRIAFLKRDYLESLIRSKPEVGLLLRISWPSAYA